MEEDYTDFYDSILTDDDPMVIIFEDLEEC